MIRSLYLLVPSYHDFSASKLSKFANEINDTADRVNQKENGGLSDACGLYRYFKTTADLRTDANTTPIALVYSKRGPPDFFELLLALWRQIAGFD